MRVRKVASGAAALCLCVVFAGGVQARAARPAATSQRRSAVRLARASGVVYQQMNHDSGETIVSQNEEPANDSFDSQAADSFTVPKHTRWTVMKVIAPGRYFFGNRGPADSENVTFYKDRGGLPGAIVRSFAHRAGGDARGTFSIAVKMKLKPGKYWVSVQANMDSAGGEWSWESRSVRSGPGAVWRNPGDGFGTGCTSYARLPNCSGAGPDLEFQLNGTSK